MGSAMEEVLKTMGWDGGFHLPVSNEENKKLEDELASLVMRKAQMTKEYEDSSVKFTDLQNHLKYVLVESKQNQNLVSAYNEQIQKQQHKFKLTMAEKDNTIAEIRQTRKNTNEISDRVALKQNDIKRGTDKIEKIKAEASWDVETMKAWEESLKKRDEDNELLKKFSAEDQRKIFELETKRKHLQEDVIERKAMLEKMFMEITNYEHIMDRTGKVLVQLKEEQGTLKTQWQESVRSMRQRDVDILQAKANTDKIQDLIKIREEELTEQNNFLENEKRNNRAAENELQEKRFLNSRLKMDILELAETVDYYRNEAEAKKHEIEHVAHDVEKQRINLKNVKKNIETAKARVAPLKEEIEQLQKKLQDTKAMGKSAYERNKTLDSLVEEMLQTCRDLESDIRSLQGVLYRNMQLYADSKQYGVAKENEVNGANSTLLNIKKRLDKGKKEYILQKQRLSDLELKVACIEAKIGNLEAQNQGEDAHKFTQKIQDLEDNLSQHNEIKALLNNQILTLQKEMTRLVSTISGDADRIQILQDKQQSLSLMYEGGVKQMAAAKLRSQKKQVELNVLKLKVDKLVKAMSKAGAEIYNLEKYRMELTWVMKERHIEIQLAKEVLVAKKKNLEEDRSRLKADVILRSCKIGQQQSKYELAIGSLGKDEVGEPLSATHFQLRLAQEKFMLQEEGDSLDQKVRRAETEIVAMENTLKVVNSANVNFKQSLSSVGEKTDDAQALKDLEYDVEERKAQLRDKKRFLISRQNHFNERKQVYLELQKTRSESWQETERLQELCAKYEKEEEDRVDKIQRADKHINKSKKIVKPERLQQFDKELYIRQLYDTTKSILHQIADFCTQHIEVDPKVKKYFQEYNLDLPKVRTSMSTISSDSVKSATSSSASVPCNVTNLVLSLDDDKSDKQDVKRKLHQHQKLLFK